MKKILVATLIALSSLSAHSSVIDEKNPLIVHNEMRDKLVLPAYGNFYICTVAQCVSFKDFEKLLADKGVENKPTKAPARDMLCYYQHELISAGKYKAGEK